MYRGHCFSENEIIREIPSKEVPWYLRLLKFLIFRKGSYWAIQNGERVVVTSHLYR